MPTRAAMQLTIDAPFNRVAELARTALARQGWRIELINEALLQLTAMQNKQERVKGVNWRYEYDAVVSWRRQGDQVNVTVEVTERQNQWTADQCKQRCQEILNGIAQNAQVLQDIERDQEPSSTYGSARWATQQDIDRAGYSGGIEDHRRLVLGPGEDDNFLTVAAADTAKHALVCGPTGCGKTSSIFIPNLIERLNTSVIVTEATAGDEPPDLYFKTAGYRFRAGKHAIYYFNPDDLTSNRINPLDAVNSIDQAQNVANLIVQNTSKKYSGGDPIWETSERHLLTALILHVAGERGHLGDVRRMMKGGPESMGMILANSQIEPARDEFMAFYKNSTEGFRNGVTSGLMQRLNLWVNPKIVALTETTDLDLNALSEQLFTFYMAVPAQKTHLKPLSALVFNFIVDLALQKHFRYPLYLSLDEFTNFGYIPAIAEKLTIIRHRGIAAMIGIQDYIQMEKVYGREDATLLFGQPGTKVFFRPRDLVTARKISESLGTRTVVERKITSSGHINEREFGRPLMDAGEIMALNDQRAIVFTPATPPILLSRFTWQEYSTSTGFPPPPREKLEVDDQIRKTCADAKEHADWQDKPAEKPPQMKGEKPKYDRNRFREGRKPDNKRQDDKRSKRNDRYSRTERPPLDNRFSEEPP
jgi:type IV secretion system protein VirD4